MPKVSVIVPVYGVEKYIEKCVRSLFEQTLDDIEYLFVDDCSPDRSIEILKYVLEEYPNRKSQVIIHRMEQNSGQAAVRKWGMLHASGEFLINCDSDDWVDLTMYEKLYNDAKNKNVDVVFCDMYYVSEKNVKINPRNIKNTSKDKIINLALTTTILNSTCDTLIKTSLVNHIVFPDGNNSEDHTIMIQAFWFANSFSYIPQGLYYYRFNDSSITNKKGNDIQAMKREQKLKNAYVINTFARKSGMLTEYKNAMYSYLFLSKADYLWCSKNITELKYWNSLFSHETSFWIFNFKIPFKTKIWSIRHILRASINSI